MIELMCDCPELQKEWIPAIGDWTNKGLVYRITRGGGIGVTSTPFYNDMPFYAYELIWLPTQKQIQNKLKEQWWSCTDHYVRTEFHRWYNESHLKHDTWELTGDEAWIAFYMYRVHSKVWKFKTKKKQWKEM